MRHSQKLRNELPRIHVHFEVRVRGLKKNPLLYYSVGLGLGHMKIQILIFLPSALILVLFRCKD